MLTLTENARMTVQDLTENAGLPESGGLRIASSSSDQGGFDLVLVAEAAPGDAVVETGGTLVYLEPSANEALADQELDADPANASTSFSVTPQA